ncbi:RNA polymerase sigma factor SigY [Paenibacillus athensensis]|uniref:RNA polymerase sigma factor SigY n=1 Tax=Paenibacillus athensensis TaxID=1967502 RepID=A0A4Y8Q8S5_9BACL|nr:RNA polymerase sigma factor SigY [Paenibacillus athensensis]MCD1260039.1 RNA polymerase sigma factor SigY [Paenibacillus athensensis]
MDEQELIRKAQRGDAESLAQLLRQHYAFVRSYMLKATLNDQLAADLTQDAVLKAMERIRLYNGQSRFSSWLITIATRLFLDHLRRSKRERLWRDQEQRRMRWSAVSRGDVWPEALDALDALDEDMRIPVILKHYYGYTYEEIGAMLQLAAGTVKSRVHYGLQQVRKELADDEQ